MKRGMFFAASATIVLILASGCRSADSVVPPPTAESLATERRRIEADSQMPQAAKQAALANLDRREQETKK